MVKKNKQTPVEELQPWQLFPPVELSPAIADKTEQQSVLIQARQTPGLPVAGGQVAHALANRAGQILFDFTQQGVAIRYQVDGLWEQMPPLPRDAGDAMLVSLKMLASLNPQDRRSAQAGKLKLKTGRDKWNVAFQSQGVATGERVLLRLEQEKLPFENLAALGMRDKMIESFREMLNDSGGFIAVSAPKGLGLSTTWQITIDAADKFVRDFQSLEPLHDPEPETINVNPNFYDETEGPNAAELLRRMLLKEPDVFLLPQIPDDETLEKICVQASKNDKHAYTRLVANDAVEAALRLVTQYPQAAKELVPILMGVTNQRLVRRLCEQCKQGFPPPPALLQRLGIPPGRVSLLFQPYVPPPIEQQVDEKGRPAPIPPCPQCQGRGYFGRIAIFELLRPSDKFRDALLKTRDLNKLRAIAKEEGHQNLQAEAVLTVARGLTSIDEVKRIFAAK
ncbi:ATPase, T2SS/T4P/T4SS family [Planctomycetaceae bacterium SH139]